MLALLSSSNILAIRVPLQLVVWRVRGGSGGTYRQPTINLRKLLARQITDTGVGEERNLQLLSPDARCKSSGPGVAQGIRIAGGAPVPPNQADEQAALAWSKGALDPRREAAVTAPPSSS